MLSISLSLCLLDFLKIANEKTCGGRDQPLKSIWMKNTPPASMTPPNAPESTTPPNTFSNISSKSRPTVNALPS